MVAGMFVDLGLSGFRVVATDSDDERADSRLTIRIGYRVEPLPASSNSPHDRERFSALAHP